MVSMIISNLVSQTHKFYPFLDITSARHFHPGKPNNVAVARKPTWLYFYQHARSSTSHSPLPLSIPPRFAHLLQDRHVPYLDSHLILSHTEPKICLWSYRPQTVPHHTICSCLHSHHSRYRIETIDYSPILWEVFLASIVTSFRLLPIICFAGQSLALACCVWINHRIVGRYDATVGINKLMMEWNEMVLDWELLSAWDLAESFWTD